MKHFTLFCFLILTSCRVFAQQDTRSLRDSLSSELKKAVKEDSSRLSLLSRLMEVSESSDLYAIAKPLLLLSEKLLPGAKTKAEKDKYLYHKANALNNIGYHFQDIGEIDSANFYYLSSLDIHKQAFNQKEISVAYLNLGSLAQLKGDMDAALKFYEDALAIQQKNADFENMSVSLNNLGNLQMSKGNIQNGITYHLKALNLREELKDSVGLTYTLLNLGGAYYMLGEFDSTLFYFNKCLQIQSLLPEKKSMVPLLNNIGIINKEKGDLPRALKFFFESLTLSEQIKLKVESCTALNNIATIYELQDDHKRGLIYHFKSLKIREEINDSEGIATSMSNIGANYYRQKKYEEAISFMNKSLSIAEKIGSKNIMAKVQNNLGALYRDKNEIDTAQFYFEKSLSISESTGNKHGISQTLNNLSKILYNKGNFTSAFNHSERSLKLATEIGNVELIRNSAEQQALILEALGRYKESIQKQRLFMTMRDSLTNKENKKEIVRKEFQYEYEKTMAQVKFNQDKKNIIAQKELQKQKLVRNGFVGGFAIMLIFAGVFFTQRNKIKKGKKISDELLLNILPAEVAEELKQNGKAEAKLFDDVTVMFTDFKNFTQISERLTPSELVAEIHTCFMAFDKIITTHNIEKIKTIGDSYMCAGGLPVKNKTNATDVVNAAIAIQAFMNQHSENRQKLSKEFFEIRIGIHTGPVVAGIVGIKKFAYDIWGDTVNIASRMESSGEPGSINISNSTYELVKDKFNCIYRGKIQAKNKGDIDMYFVSSSMGES